MGFHRGQIIIYNVHKFDCPQARYEICKNQILMIREIQGDEKMYAVYDDTFSITLC